MDGLKDQGVVDLGVVWNSTWACPRLIYCKDHGDDLIGRYGAVTITVAVTRAPEGLAGC